MIKNIKNEDDLYEKLLEHVGFHGSNSPTFPVWLKRIKEENYDTVLLDISMPEFGGIDIIHTLEREKRLKDQKIVIFSAISFTDSEIHHLLQKEGVQVCIQKPIELNKLLTSITC